MRQEDRGTSRSSWSIFFRTDNAHFFVPAHLHSSLFRFEKSVRVRLYVPLGGAIYCFRVVPYHLTAPACGNRHHYLPPTYLFSCVSSSSHTFNSTNILIAQFIPKYYAHTMKADRSTEGSLRVRRMSAAYEQRLISSSPSSSLHDSQPHTSSFGHSRLHAD